MTKIRIKKKKSSKSMKHLVQLYLGKPYRRPFKHFFLYSLAFLTIVHVVKLPLTSLYRKI